jgi:hypothetical protein
LKQPAIAIAALCIVGGAVSASAQEGCAGYYNRVMGAYQTLGPGSPEYNQMAADYGARCLSAAAAPQPYPYGGYYPAPYAAPGPYYAPAYDPGAAFVGGVLLGGALGGFDRDHRRR